MTEPSLDRTTRRLIALGSILAPALHSVTAVMIGLYAAQRPRISRLGMVGALLYGFAWASLQAGVLPRCTATSFLLGLSINLLLGLLPAPELLQTIGTAVRNAELIGMGWAIGQGGESRA